jgi:hypothetical protein
MAITAELFDGTILEFPEGTDPTVIQATAKRVTLERQMAGEEMPRNELGEIVRKDPQGSKAYQAIKSFVDPIRPYVEPVTDYVGEQASLVAGAGLKGVANLQTSIAQSQVAGLMELQEARKATYGTFENMPPKEQENYLKAQKVIEGKLQDVAKLGVEKKEIEKKYGVRESTKALDSLSQSPEYKDASFIDKMRMIGSKIGDDPFGIITDLGIESIPQSYAIASAAIATRFGMLNPKIAAGVGGASSGMMQFGNEYAALREQGMDHVEAWEKAGVKSGIVGLFDAASFYSAGKAAGAVVDNIKKGAVKETVKTVAKETGKQAGLGAAGEGFGSAAIGQEIDPLELTKEAIGEVFGAPGDAIATYQGKVAEARAAGKPDPEPPANVAKMMADKDLKFKKRDEFAEAPQIDITGVGQVPEDTQGLPEDQLIEDLEASQDRRAMLAELEDERDLDSQLKQVTVQEPEVKEAPPAEPKEKEPEFAKAVNVKDFNPEDKATIRAMEVERNKIGREKKLFPEFLRRQGIQPSEKADLGLEGIRRADIFKKAAPTFDELTSRAISEGFLLSTGDDVQDVENFRQFVSDYIGSGIIGTGPDVAREGQLRAIDDAIQEIVRKYEQPKTNLADEARAIADQFAQIGQTGPAQAIIKGIEDGQPVTPATIEFLRGKLQELSQPAPMELTGQTPDQARAEAEALELQRAEEQRVASEQQRAEQEARDRAEIARRSEGAAEDFQLGQTAEENLTGQKDIFAEPKEAKPAYTPPKLRTDNPGGEWLKNKREQSIEDGKKKSGVPIRFGSVTGYFREGNDVRKPLIPVEVLARLQGMNDEQNNVRQKDLEAIKKIMDETGRLPPAPDGEDYVPFINVYQDGTAYVNEGNHRIMAAKALGFKYLPVEISYFNGAEQIESGDLSPKMVISYDMQARDDKITLDNYRGEKKQKDVGYKAYPFVEPEIEKPKRKTPQERAKARDELAEDLKVMPREGMTPSEVEVMNLADQIEAAGQPGFATSMRINVKDGKMKDQVPPFYKQRLKDFRAQQKVGTEPVSETKSMEDFAEGYERDVERLRQAKGLFATETSDMLDRSNEYIQKLTDRLNRLGYKMMDVSTNSPINLQNIRTKMSEIAGSTSRLLKQSEALEKGYARADEEKYRQVINQLLEDYKDADDLLAKTPKSITADKDPDADIPFNIERKQTSTPAFKKWFGKSKVVDENGKPLVVYHGTDAKDFSVFNPASYFSESPKEAGRYSNAQNVAKRERGLKRFTLTDDTSPSGKTVPYAGILEDHGDFQKNKIYATDNGVYKFVGNGKFEAYSNIQVDYDTSKYLPNGDITVELKTGKSQEAIDTVESYKKNTEDYFAGGDEGRVYPAYVSIQNPVYLDALEANKLGFRLGATPESIKKTIDKYKSMGYDGIITESDEAVMNYSVRRQLGGIPKQYIPFEASQIKSATGNIGTFDETNPDIRFDIKARAAEPPAYAEEVERRPSLRVGMRRLMRQFNAGKIAPETLANRVEFELEFTKDKKKPQPRERGAFYVKERLNKAARKGELSAEAVQLAEWFISKNPALLDDLGISIVTPAEDEVASGFYKPSTRIMTLITHSSNDETAVHEILHHLERMLPDKLQEGIRKSWFTSLAKAAKAADKGTDKDLKRFYESLLKYHVEGDRKAMKVAEKLLEDGTVDYEHYQHINPSEFWAVNAADIVAGRYAQSKSTVGKLKQWLKELYQKLKSIFGLQSSAPILRALDSLAKADGRFVNTVMIGEATQYMNRKNYKGGQAPLASWQDPQESKLDNWIYKVQDKLIDTKRVQQAITQQVGEIDDQWNAYMKEELYHGRTAKRTQDFLKNELAPIVKELSKAGIEIIEFDQFLHNRHAEERNVQIAKINPNMPDAGSGITTADAQQYMKDLDPTKRKLLEKLGNKIDDMVQGTQKILIDSGLEEQSTIDAWNSAYKHYVPLKREDVDFVHTGTGLGQGYATRGGTSARATGSLKDVAEIFANLALQRERAIIRSEKARIGKALYALAIKYANPDFWLAVNPDAMKNKAKLEQELISMGLDPLDAKNLIQEPRQQYIDPRTGLVAWRVNPILRTSDNVFPVRINGQDRFIFFNSSDERAMRMVSALKNLDAEQLDIVLATTANVTRWIASVNTQYNPVFGAWNFARDVQGAALNLSTTPLAGKQKEVIKNTFPALKGIYSDLRSDGKATGMWADLWEDFQKAGGQTGYRDQFSRNRKQASVVEREMGAMKRGNVKKAAYAVAQWLSDYNDAMENAVRLSAYKTALDMGLSKDKAASIAKNLTVNFNRKGTWSQTVGALYAFFNASVQGTARLAQTMKGPAGRKIFYGGLALGTLQAIALAAAGFDDDEPPEFIKSRNLIIPTGGKKYIAIPMPLGFNLFPNIGRLTTEFVVSGGKKPAQKTLDMVSAIFNTFNPIGGSGLQFVAPTIADPAVALYTNVDSFGRPIYKEDRATAPTPGYTRSREQATTVNKYIAEFLNYATGGTKYQKGLLSPTADQLDYLVGQATGGVGRETMKAVGAVKALATGEELPSYKVPLVGKLYGNTESPANIASKFYSNVTQLANYENEIKGRQKNRENVGAFLREHPEARLYQRANQLENQISQINRDKKELQEKKAPQKQIDVLEKRKTMLMDKFNKDYKKLAK